MKILTVRTDKPESEIGLYYDHEQINYESWQAHLELSKTIHTKLKEILNKSSISLDNIEGIVCYEGPGSFTGLRIGMSVANGLAYAKQIPIVATNGDDWIKSGIAKLLEGKNDKIVHPLYSHAAITTQPRK